jgi:hypothetical protein
MTMKRSGVWSAAASAAAAVIGLGGAADRAAAQSPQDYLVQMVCTGASDVAIFGDPVDCPNNRRKLYPGEPLPYHKIDTGGYQISDSFPIVSTDGTTRGVQTYFFMSDLNKDPLFPNQPFQYQPHGGYNILGSNSSWVFYRGTSDPARYWSPWWQAGCQASGWRLFPNTSAAFSYGNTIHGLTTSPDCPSTVPTANALLEWTLYSGYPFIVSSTDASKNKTLDALAAYHFARNGDGSVGDLEISFFTREYGATRWEAWRKDTPSAAVQQAMNARCPGVLHEASFHGAAYFMHDCRNWTTIIAPLDGTPWDPDGTSALNPDVRRWGVDPLYTGGNHLRNTHQATGCSDSQWQTINSPTAIVKGTVSDDPWAMGNCVRTIRSDAIPAGAYYQVIAAPPVRATPYRFGLSAWRVGGGGASLRVEIIQRNDAGLLVGHSLLNAATIGTPRWFEGQFDRAPGATQIFFALYPNTPGAEFAVTGAYIH